MTKIITRVSIAYPTCQTYKYYRYEQLSSSIYSLLCSALLAGLKNGDIVDYMIYNREVLSNDEKRH
nr:MAG TPA: hypothetical protein [Caudoviricetes sp.]